MQLLMTSVLIIFFISNCGTLKNGFSKNLLSFLSLDSTSKIESETFQNCKPFCCQNIYRFQNKGYSCLWADSGSNEDKNKRFFIRVPSIET